MFYQPHATAVQGTSAAPYPYALTSAARNLLLTLLVLLSACLSSFAQETDQLPLDPLHWELSHPPGSFAAGDTVEFVFLLGEDADPITGGVGYALGIDLSPAAEHSAVEVSHHTSWLFDDAAYTDSAYIDPAETDLLHLDGNRTDGTTRTDHGELLRFKLIVKEAVSSASDLIDDVGGHVLVDNVEMRLMPGEETDPAAESHPVASREDCPTWKAYPNPAADHVTLSADQAATATLQLLDNHGVARRTIRKAGQDIGLEALQSLPDGIYQLQIISENGCRENKRLVIQH